MPSSLRSARHARLAELLIGYWEQAGLKQSDVAAALGRHQPFISNIEAGERRVDVVELLQLAEILGFDPHELIAELMKVPASPT